MSYDTLTQDQQAFLTATLTALQLEVVRRRLDKHTWQRIADSMNLDEATIRGHHKRATRRLANATRTPPTQTPATIMATAITANLKDNGDTPHEQTTT